MSMVFFDDYIDFRDFLFFEYTSISRRKSSGNTALIIHRNSIKRAYNSTRKPKKRPI